MKTIPSVVTPDHPSQVRFAELLLLRTLAASTREEYQRYIRKLATRGGRDPAELDEAQVRAHVLHLKTAQHYSPSSMRTAVAALQLFYGGLLGREWRLFNLVRSPSAKTLPAVLTRAEPYDDRRLPDPRLARRAHAIGRARRAESCARQQENVRGGRTPRSPVVAGGVFHRQSEEKTADVRSGGRQIVLRRRAGGPSAPPQSA